MKYTFDMPDDLNEQFRKKVFELYGWKKGNLNKGLEEAIRFWVKKENGGNKNGKKI